jgi:hypothetical protein
VPCCYTWLPCTKLTVLLAVVSLIACLQAWAAANGVSVTSTAELCADPKAKEAVLAVGVGETCQDTHQLFLSAAVVACYLLWSPY